MVLILNKKRKLAIVLLAMSASMVAFAAAFAATEESSADKRKRIKRSADTMHNLWAENTHPEMPLVLKPILDHVFEDPGRNYCRILTHFFGWELFALAEHLNDYIQLPRTTTDKMIEEIGIENIPVRSCKPTVCERLFYTLQWLSTGKSFRTAQFDTGWSKTSCNDDLRHVLKAIIRGLNHFVQWPNAEERHEMANQSSGIFKGCVGIMDCSEHVVERPANNSTVEKRRYSGKAKAHTLKTMAVIDRQGYFRYVVTGVEGSINDREMLTTSPLYLERGKYFSEGEYVATDGGFMGDGPVFMSYNNMHGDRDKELFNNAFKEVRITVENAFGRVQSWFPILGNAKSKFDCDDDLLYLSVHAAVRLHNWMLHTRQLNYDVTTSGNALFSQYF